LVHADAHAHTTDAQRTDWIGIDRAITADAATCYDRTGNGACGGSTEINYVFAMRNVSAYFAAVSFSGTARLLEMPLRLSCLHHDGARRLKS
jgi:hypothetical protein